MVEKDFPAALRSVVRYTRQPEKSVPAPYLPDAPSQLVTLFPNRDRTVYFENHKKPSVTIIKENSITHDPIQDAEFHITWASNKMATGEIRDLGPTGRTQRARSCWRPSRTTG